MLKVYNVEDVTNLRTFHERDLVCEHYLLLGDIVGSRNHEIENNIKYVKLISMKPGTPKIRIRSEMSICNSPDE